MNDTMAKRKKAGRPPADAPLRKPMCFRPTEEMERQVELYLSSFPYRPTPSQVLRTLMEKELERVGLWPPPEDSDQ